MTSSSSSDNALDLLIRDHRSLQQLFDQYEAQHGNAPPEEKQALADEICEQFTRHADLEEQWFYPAARKALADGDLIDEAEVEHASARELIAQIRAMHPGEPLYDAKVRVLGEQVAHHVEEEEKEMFPAVEKTGLDLDAIGQQMLAAKASSQRGINGGRARGSSGQSAHR